MAYFRPLPVQYLRSQPGAIHSGYLIPCATLPYLTYPCLGQPYLFSVGNLQSSLYKFNIQQSQLSNGQPLGCIPQYRAAM